MKNFRPILLLFLFSMLILAASPAFAIIIRHDRDDERYLALGAKYPVVGHFQERVGCTLIAPQWAMTAAHVVEGNPAFLNYYVVFGGKRYNIEKIILHPNRVRNTIDSSADIALLKLSEPVVGIQPALLYDRMDEGGKQVILAGYGRTGNGRDGQTGERGKLRGATNEIEGALENSLLLVFDAPPHGTDLEGVSGAGDSGSPALYEEAGKLYVMGVGSFNSGSEKAGTAGNYGTFEGYARVSTRRSWILEQIEEKSSKGFWGDFRIVKNGRLPKDAFGRRARAFFQAFNSGKESEIARFYAEHRPPHPDKLSPEQRADGWQELMDQYGQYTVRGFAREAGGRFTYLVVSEREKIWRAVYVEFEEKEPFRVTGMSMGDVTPPANSGLK